MPLRVFMGVPHPYLVGGVYGVGYFPYGQMMGSSQGVLTYKFGQNSSSRSRVMPLRVFMGVPHPLFGGGVWGVG